MGEKVQNNLEKNLFLIEARRILQETKGLFVSLQSSSNLSLLHSQIHRQFFSLKAGASLNQFEQIEHLAFHMLANWKKLATNSRLHPEHMNYFLNALNAIDAAIDVKDYKFDPLAFQINPDQITSQETSVFTHSYTAKKNIYVIDDQASVLEILKKIISMGPYQVHTFEEPKKAVQHYLEQSDLNRAFCVLTDVMMPQMSGMQVLKAFHELDPYLPVVFLSGDLSKDEVIQAVDNGIYSIMEKPFLPEKILKVIETAVNKYSHLRLLDSSMRLLCYQFSEVENTMIEMGKTENLHMIRSQIQDLIRYKNELADIMRKTKN